MVFVCVWGGSYVCEGGSHVCGGAHVCVGGLMCVCGGGGGLMCAHVGLVHSYMCMSLYLHVSTLTYTRIHTCIVCALCVHASVIVCVSMFLCVHCMHSSVCTCVCTVHTYVLTSQHHSLQRTLLCSTCHLFACFIGN